MHHAIKSEEEQETIYVVVPKIKLYNIGKVETVFCILIVRLISVSAESNSPSAGFATTTGAFIA